VITIYSLFKTFSVGVVIPAFVREIIGIENENKIAICVDKQFKLHTNLFLEIFSLASYGFLPKNELLHPGKYLTIIHTI